MKKIFLVLLLATVLLPLPAAAQQWVEPSMQPDGTMNPGYWATPKEGWQNPYNSPGTMNPFTGNFNPYGRKAPLTSTAPSVQSARNSTGVPGSSAPNSFLIPGSNAPNPYLIPGSGAPNPYSALRSNPNQTSKEGTDAQKPK